jgi:hypothetical protein
MIDHIWSILCSNSIIDIETNNVSILNVIDQITVNAEPSPDGFLPMPFEVVTLWVRSEKDSPAQGMERLLLVSPSSETTVAAEAVIDLTKADRHRHRVKFSGIPAKEQGRHYFKVEVKESTDTEWRQVAAIPLMIMFEKSMVQA